MPGEVTGLVWVDDLGDTPAKSNRYTGVIYLSLKHMRRLPFEHRLYVVLHEQGHIVLQTTDEVACDEYAFNEYAKRGYSLTKSVTALTRILNGDNPEHFWRMYLEVERAKKFDYEVNGNTKVYDN